MTTNRRWLTAWVALAAGIGIYAVIPGKVADHVWQSGSIEHVWTFAALMALAPRAFPATERIRLAAGLAAAGVAIEIVQLGVPGRDFEWEDLVADACGIGLGWALAALITGRRPR